MTLRLVIQIPKYLIRIIGFLSAHRKSRESWRGSQWIGNDTYEQQSITAHSMRRGRGSEDDVLESKGMIEVKGVYWKAWSTVGRRGRRGRGGVRRSWPCSIASSR